MEERGIASERRRSLRPLRRLLHFASVIEEAALLNVSQLGGCSSLSYQTILVNFFFILVQFLIVKKVNFYYGFWPRRADGLPGNRFFFAIVIWYPSERPVLVSDLKKFLRSV